MPNCESPHYRNSLAQKPSTSDRSGLFYFKIFRDNKENRVRVLLELYLLYYPYEK